MWWQSVKELLEYAKSEKPDAYEVLRLARQISDEWDANKPPTTNDPDAVFYVQHS